MNTQLCFSFSSSASDDVQVLEYRLASIMDWTRAKKLKQNPDKMEILLLERYLSGFDGVTLALEDQVDNVRVLLGPTLSIEVQISVVARSAFYLLQFITRLKNKCVDNFQNRLL